MKTLVQSDLFKQIRKPMPPPSKPHKPKGEKRHDYRREISTILAELTAKIRHVDY